MVFLSTDTHMSPRPPKHSPSAPKTFAAANIAYRLIRYGHARRVCFLVDRTNLGIQTTKEFQQFLPPGERQRFDKLYNLAFPHRNRFDPVNRVVITTIQRLYSVLTAQPELAEEDEERSSFEGPGAFKKPLVPVRYSEALPPEFVRRHHLPHRHAEQADDRLFQPEPGDGIHARRGGRRPG
jgi:hypothetical protein